jgi:hypothetical protein
MQKPLAGSEAEVTFRALSGFSFVLYFKSYDQQCLKENQDIRDNHRKVIGQDAVRRPQENCSTED